MVAPSLKARDIVDCEMPSCLASCRPVTRADALSRVPSLSSVSIRFPASRCSFALTHGAGQDQRCGSTIGDNIQLHPDAIVALMLAGDQQDSDVALDLVNRGLRTVINAAGTMTVIGASRAHPAAIATAEEKLPKLV